MALTMQGPIGVFDSGIGGLTVVREIFNQLPNETVTFFGDTARLPYGPKSSETVIQFSRQNAQLLLSRGVRSIVVACNTASAVALPTLERECPVPVVGVIVPGAEAALRETRTGRIGVVGTRGTIASRAYDNYLAAQRADIFVRGVPCPLLVPLAEEGWTDHPVTERVVGEYIAPLLAEKIDTLILGCTHYPVLKKTIQKVVGPDVVLIDNAVETAALLCENLAPADPTETAGPIHRFMVSDVPHRFQEEAELFLGRPIGSIEQITLEELEAILGGP